MSIVYVDGAFGLSTVDVSTGEFLVTEVGSLPEALDEIVRFSPSEIICNNAFSLQSDLLNSIKERYGIPVTVLDNAMFDERTATGEVLRHFKVKSLIGKKVSPSLYQALGIFLPLITTNCAVLGVAINVVTKEFSFVPGGMLNLGQALVYAFATSLGYGLAMVIFAGIREHLALNNVPKAFKGVPIAIISVGILALAFMGFSGMVK